MVVGEVTPYSITMTNKDNDIVLGRGEVIHIMTDLYFRVADSEDLRYQLCSVHP